MANFQIIARVSVDGKATICSKYEKLGQALVDAHRWANSSVGPNIEVIVTWIDETEVNGETVMEYKARVFDKNRNGVLV